MTVYGLIRAIVTFFKKICQNRVGFDCCFGSTNIGLVTTPYVRHVHSSDQPMNNFPPEVPDKSTLTNGSNVNELKSNRSADSNQEPIKDAVSSNPPEQPTPTVPTISNSRDDLAQQIVPVFKVLSDITRLRLFLVLAECKEMNVRDLCKVLGKNQPTISHHLSLMREVNFVTNRIDGKTHYYRIMPEQIEKVIAHIFKTNVGSAGYLQFPKFQVEYHPRDKGILPKETSASTTK